MSTTTRTKKRKPLLGAQAPRPTAEHVDTMTTECGWAQPMLIRTEALCWGRWPYWSRCLSLGSIGDEPIPQIPFTSLWRTDGLSKARFADIIPEFAQEIGTGLDAKNRVIGTLRKAAFETGTSASDIIDWLLWAVGSQSIEKRPALQGSAAITLYHELRFEDILAWPGDWGSEIVRELISERYGQRSGWFPTPIDICNCMVAMLHSDYQREGIDYRCETMMEPCCGTGAMLLPASNYHLRIYANDIDLTMVRLTELAGWFFIPWLVIPGSNTITEFAAHDQRLLATQKTEPQIATPVSMTPGKLIQPELF